jgi:hypothetical protein
MHVATDIMPTGKLRVVSHFAVHHTLLITAALAAASWFLLSPTAAAQVTYTYTGNPFTTVGGTIGVTTSNHISASFSVPEALAPNLNCANVETSGTGTLLSFNMSDGVHSFGLAPNTQVFCISTSASGQITQWIVGNFTAGSFPFIVSTNIPITGNENDEVAFTSTDFASVRNNPGSWSASSAPNTLVQICLGKSNAGPTFCEIGDDEKSVQNSSVTISDTFGSTAEGAQLVGAAAGSAGYGRLKASSSATFDISGAPGHAFGHAISTFQDSMTVSSPPFDGSRGTISLMYTLSGTPSSSGAATGLGTVQGSVNGHAFAQQYTSPVAGLFLAGSFPFIYGQPFPPFFQLSADSGTIIPSGSAGDICVFCTGSGQASANFLNTFVLSAFELLDPNGNPLASPVTITSSSGTPYSVNGVLTSFANFLVRKLNIAEREEEFEIEGSFRLASTSNGIDPPTQDVGLQIGTFSTVIPAGSFHASRNHYDGPDAGAAAEALSRYEFRGVINGVRLKFEIRGSHGGDFKFHAEGHGANLREPTQPTTIRLSIGDDEGITMSLAN